MAPTRNPATSPRLTKQEDKPHSCSIKRLSRNDLRLHVNTMSDGGGVTVGAIGYGAVSVVIESAGVVDGVRVLAAL